MPMFFPDTVVIRSPALLAAEVDGETMLMSIERGNYYGLADTGHDIWSRLAEPVRVADLCAALAAEYAAPADRIAADTMAFLRRLAEEGLIDVTPPDGATSVG